jgi:hypothetical protein
MLFPKESNWRYAAGAILVLGGLTVASLDKQYKKRNKSVEIVAAPDACLVPALPYEDKLCNDAMEQGQADEKNEFRPLLNLKSNGPERRR